MNFNLNDIPLPPTSSHNSAIINKKSSQAITLDKKGVITIKNAFQIAKSKLSHVKKPQDEPIKLQSLNDTNKEKKDKIGELLIPLPHETCVSKKLPKIGLYNKPIPPISPINSAKEKYAESCKLEKQVSVVKSNGENPRKRKSRWSTESERVTNVIPAPLIMPLINSGFPLFNVTKTENTYDLMSNEQKIQFEESRKMQALCSYILAKTKMTQIYQETGKVKYEYDSDEDTTDGTWEHKRRKAEMDKTKELADLLTDMGRDKHHVGDFLPPEEFDSFMYNYHLLREAELAGTPELFDESYGFGDQNIVPVIQENLESNVSHLVPLPDIPSAIKEPKEEAISEIVNNPENHNNSDAPIRILEEATLPIAILEEIKDELETVAVTDEIKSFLNEPDNLLSAVGSSLKLMTKEKLLNLKKKTASDYQGSKLNFDNNIGYRILMKMGWDQEQGLGACNQGIVDPVNKAKVLPNRLGLGTLSARGACYNPDLEFGDNEYDAYRKRMMLAYRFRPNPLNNPRRSYY